MVTVTVSPRTKGTMKAAYNNTASGSTASTSFVDATEYPSITSVPQNSNIILRVNSRHVTSASIEYWRVVNSGATETYIDYQTPISLTTITYSGYTPTGNKGATGTDTVKVQAKVDAGTVCYYGTLGQGYVIYGQDGFAFLGTSETDKRLNIPVKVNITSLDFCCIGSDDDAQSPANGERVSAGCYGGIHTGGADGDVITTLTTIDNVVTTGIPINHSHSHRGDHFASGSGVTKGRAMIIVVDFSGAEIKVS